MDRFDTSGKLVTEQSQSISDADFLATIDHENDQEIFSILLDPEMDYYDITAEYLVRGAVLRCDCGSHARKLNLPLCHGVYHMNHPVVHQKDAEVGDDKHIPSFGVCSSPKHPAAKLFGERITLVSEDDPSKNVKGCPCTPVIVGGEWKNPKYETMIADSVADAQQISPEDRTYYPAVTTESFLVCKYFGLIEPVTSGQECQENIITEDELKDMQQMENDENE